MLCQVNQAEIIQLIVGWTLTGAFVFTVVMTCLAMVGWIKFADSKQHNKLFTILVVEIVIGGVGHFVGLLKFDPESIKTFDQLKEIVVAKFAPVVPQPDDLEIVEEISKISDANFELLKDISVFDLRSWNPVSSSDTTTRLSPANFINYLHAIKKSEDANWFKAHYSTSGTAIDLRSITHNAKIRKKAMPEIHEDTATNEYEVVVDVADIPVNKEFIVVIEGTYWNAFSNDAIESASTYADEANENLELAMIILFPEGKLMDEYRLWEYPTDTEEKREIRQGAYKDPEGRFLYWGISEPKGNYHYEVTWEW